MATDKNPDDQKVCPILFNKDFQVCRVNLCQHRVTQPLPSTEQQQDRASGTLQSTEWEGEASAKQALPSAVGMRGCTSDTILLFFLTTWRAIHFRASFCYLGYIHMCILEAVVYNSELLVVRFHMYYLKKKIYVPSQLQLLEKADNKTHPQTRTEPNQTKAVEVQFRHPQSLVLEWESETHSLWAHEILLKMKKSKAKAKYDDAQHLTCLVSLSRNQQTLATVMPYLNHIPVHTLR